MDSEWRDQTGDSLSTEAPEALTSIHGTYTLASPHEPDANEVDSVMVKYFLNTLAEVALAVASRKVEPGTP